MKPISDRYKNDKVGEIRADIKERLDKLFWQTRPNLKLANPKVLVIFSGTNGVGKSTIANKIEQELGGLVLENDAIKRILIKEYPEISHKERGLITWNYTMNLYEDISNLTNNGLIVRDGVIDWYFDRILPLFVKQGFSIFIIAFSVSKDRNKELILQRGDTETVSTDLLINQIDEHKVHIKRFHEAYTPDIVLDDSNLFDHEKVIQCLKMKIASIHT